MNKLKTFTLLFALLLALSCEQEVIQLQDPEPEPEPTGSPGSANFTKFVAIGNSLTAGFMANALFDFGQQNSFPAIMAQHFAYVSENDPFDQPLTGSINGCSNPAGGCTLGRLILFDPDGPGPQTPRPVPAGSPSLPAPYNTGPSDHSKALAPYTGNKEALNNFGVPGIILAQVLTPLTGGPPTGNPAFNPYYARFASNPGTSTILGDALATNPTFVSFWLGNNDVLGYAVGGASNPALLTSVPAFTGQFSTAIDAIMNHNPNIKAAVANIPYVTDIPYFRTVPFNPVPLDAASANQLNTAFAGYNAALDALKDPAFNGAFGTSAQLDARKITFTASNNNRVVLIDESLIDLAPGFDALLGAGFITPEQRAALAPYERVRQSANTDRLVLPAASFIGTLVDNNLQLINGVTVPLADQWVLTATELQEIRDRIDAFNNAIATKVGTYSERIALVNINQRFSQLANSPTGGLVVDGMFIRATFAPPNGIFSEDAVHPNPRGAAYIAKVFIEAINAKFGATVPLPNISKYYGTYSPINP